jgi:serine/threonine protein phosphatase 1
MSDLFKRLLGPAGPPPRILHEARWPKRIYAIGDVHGCLEQMLELQARIIADAQGEDDCWMVYLGDLIDRGPSSAGVIDEVLAPPPPGFRKLALRGNHESMMLRAIDRGLDRDWLRNGGTETLLSYGVDTADFSQLSKRERMARLAASVPDEHLRFLREALVAIALPGLVLVHAGLRPGIPLDQQTEDDMLWIRDSFFAAPWQANTLVVHGHTPATEPVITPHRICVDTGAFATGVLTAVRLMSDQAPMIIRSNSFI